MTNTRQTALPSTVAEWEAVLVERFLRIGADGDASPIRSFEITAHALASACGADGATSAEAEAAFHMAMRADPDLWGALREGRRRPATATSPNCFTYLAMTLLIDTLLDGDYSRQGQFRERLRSWLGTTRSMMRLSGVATMWRALAAWLDVRVAAGEPFRRLVLPPPRTWTQIGYTRRLSFPTRADVRFLERVMAGFKRGVADPPGLIRTIDAAIGRGGASWGMEAAFHEFRDVFRAGAASTDHRFWRLVLRSARTPDRGKRDEAVLELAFDEDARRSILLGSADNVAALSVVASIGFAMRSGLVTRSVNLSASATRGITFFRQIGMARWRAQSDPPSGATATHVAFSATLAHRAQGAVLSLEQSGDWCLTTVPVDHHAMDDLLSRLQFARMRGEQLLDIALVDGVRVGSAWLGRRAFLPRIDAGDRLTSVTRLPGQDNGASITVRDGALTSRETVDGLYEVSAMASVDGDVPGWSRHVRFVADATPHPDFARAAYGEPLVREWLALDPARTRITLRNELAWSDEDPASTDLLEALYAAGRSGMSEAEVVDFVARGADARTETWSLLRSILESGFIESRQRRRWRGRVWTLGKPTLTALEGITSGIVVVEGATCAALEREFREVANRMGGIPFRRPGASTWSPAIIGATGVGADALATRLGWEVATRTLEPRLLPGALETSDLVAEHHVLASSWDWDRRRFVTGAVGPCEVSLTRWVHPGGRDHDVYRIRSAGHVSSHMTRNAAILAAHVVARTPLFRVEGDMLVRTSKEGALPLELARWLRLVALAGGGALDGDGYGYPLGGVDPTGIARALPGCVYGTTETMPTRSSVEMLTKARRSGGRARVRWVDGGMAIT